MQRKRLLIIMLCFFAFSVPSFAYTVTSDGSTSFNRAYEILDNAGIDTSKFFALTIDNGRTYTDSNGNVLRVILYEKLGETNQEDLNLGYGLNMFNCYDVTISGTGSYKYKSEITRFATNSGNGIYYYNDSSLVSLLSKANLSSHLSNSTYIEGRGSSVVVPPTLAPNVGLDLSTESVLSGMIPLIPIILAFLVLYFGFWKAWSMLLNLLHKV